MTTLQRLVADIGDRFRWDRARMAQYPVTATAALTATAVVLAIAGALALMLWVLHFAIRLTVISLLGLFAIVVYAMDQANKQNNHPNNP